MAEIGVMPTADELLATARERAGGLSDFGHPSFREGLEVFLASMREDDGYTAEGIAQTREGFIGRLVTRLKVEDWYRSHPEIEDEQIESPLFITGLPRTGTSAFANVLSLEPGFRCLRSWEQLAPVPPPVAGDEAHDPRRAAAIARTAAIHKDRPDLQAMHLHEVDATTEDVPLLGLEFKPQSFTTPTYAYHAWWRDCDMAPVYRYHRRILRLLQSRRGPNRWLIKAPHYAFHLEAVAGAYPDARFVITHRDPVKAIPSWASFLAKLQPPGSFEKTGGAQKLGPRCAEHQAIGLEKMIAARARIGEERFLDVHHHAFVSDPLGTLERVYAFAGLEMAAETRARMAEWSARNRPGTFGEHRYSAESFGLNDAALRDQFAFYTDRYGVRLEDTVTGA